jgi:hypothetical protein
MSWWIPSRYASLAGFAESSILTNSWEVRQAVIGSASLGTAIARGRPLHLISFQPFNGRSYLLKHPVGRLHAIERSHQLPTRVKL